jgi:hypothetical protein
MFLLYHAKVYVQSCYCNIMSQYLYNHVLVMSCRSICTTCSCIVMSQYMHNNVLLLSYRNICAINYVAVFSCSSIWKIMFLLYHVRVYLQSCSCCICSTVRSCSCIVMSQIMHNHVLVLSCRSLCTIMFL